MVTGDEETRKRITETVAQLASNYKLAQKKTEKSKIEKQAKEFIKDVANGEDEIKEYLAMYNEMKA